MLMPFFLTHAERPSFFSRPMSLCMVTITCMYMYMYNVCTIMYILYMYRHMYEYGLGGGGGGEEEHRSRILPDQPKWGCYGPVGYAGKLRVCRN